MEQVADEVKALRTCMNDLISVLALPAIWSGGETSQMCRTLLDALLGMLRLDFAYIRLGEAIGAGTPIEMVQVAQRRNVPDQSADVGRALHPWLTADPPTVPLVVPNPVGDGKVSIAPLRLGFQDDMGVLVAASARPGFPTPTEKLLLDVAANQAVIGLQEARRLIEQKRIAQELDRRVAERTRELIAVNETLRKTQTDLAHVTRVTTLGELTASIAHEVNQPLAAVVSSGDACVNWLAATPPNIEKAQECARQIVRDGFRAGEIVARIRMLTKKAAPVKAPVDLNEAIQEVLAIMTLEAHRHQVAMRTELAAGLPTVEGDRVQLQQVLLNLVMNGIEAMQPVADRPRELIVQSRKEASGLIGVAVSDTGIGLDPQSMARLFETFYTTKPDGLGMGLSICRSIIEAHGGRLWVTANLPRGAVFQFRLPVSTSITP